ncbi:MAG: protein kinase [Burkholderiaceae bacterium]|nr:protein kinase [Burkholderiaceae bacterium]
MLTVLIVDDDESVRTQAMQYLAGPDIRLATAADGRLALEQAELLKPDIVICDVDMPEINGFDVLAQLKASPALASTQVMMLTGQTSRRSMRLGMSLGADDYLTKPFTEAELRDALDGLIKRRGRIEVLRGSPESSHEDSLRHWFAAGVAGGVTTRVPSGNTLPAAVEHRIERCMVIAACIHSFTAVAQRLPQHDLGRLLTEYSQRLGGAVIGAGGQRVRFMGDRLVAVFGGDQAAESSHAQAVLSAALAAIGAADAVVRWSAAEFPDAGLPAWHIGFGVAYGEVQLTAGSGLAGGTVDEAHLLALAAAERGWHVLATDAVIARLPVAARLGRTTALERSGGQVALAATEVTAIDDDRGRQTLFETTVRVGAGNAAGAEATLPEGAPSPELDALRESARSSSEMAARAFKDALGDKLSQLRRADALSSTEPLRLAGYEVVRRLGAGGMSSIFLARSEADASLAVLKVISLDPSARDMTARFVREFALLTRIEHPHIVRLFGQGFTDDTAYIAMEYFENGDLRARMKGPMPVPAALKVAVQVAQALREIHAMGIVHRDLKPENLMVRANGDVVLADFGIAKVTGAAAQGHEQLTVMGDVMGSPSYMSPEQCAATDITAQSDQYSLGVVLYELLAGERPFQSESFVELLGMHMRRQAPPLTGEAAVLQPVVARLMAKKPADRFESMDAVLAALGALEVPG